MRSVGQLGLLATFVFSGYAAIACILGWRANQRAVQRSGLAAGVAGLFALSVSMAALLYGLLVKDFRFAYVAEYASRQLPWHYTLSAMWVGQAGSLLLWSWFSVALAVAFRLWPRRRCSSLREPAFGLIMGFCCFLTAVMLFAADPLAPSLAPPGEGAGLSPILQHPAMLIHPPVVFLAYAAWSIPCALALTALATGNLDAAWTQEARPWTLFAWAVLGGGILLGAEWAYTELGWGGYWGWDPVENGSLIPWLIGTAALHSHFAWRQRGMLKKSALALTIATFGMCNFATFLTRSGIFSSLHAFSQSPIGWLFLAFMLGLGLSTGVLIAIRRHNLAAENSLATWWSRESMIVVSALSFVALALVTCMGTLSPLVSDALTGRKIVVGTEFYNNALIPSGLLIMLASGAAPLLRWGAVPNARQAKTLRASLAAACVVSLASLIDGGRQPLWAKPLWAAVCGLFAFSLAAFFGAWFLDARRSTGTMWYRLLMPLRTQRRQYAGFVVHIGFFCLALGVAGSALGSRRDEVTLQVGETIEWAGRRVRLAGINQRQLPGILVLEAALELEHGSARSASALSTLSHWVSRLGVSPGSFTKTGVNEAANSPNPNSGSRRSTRLVPAQHFHLLQREWTTEVSIHSTWGRDYYAILHGGEEDGRVRLSLIENPMMRFIWLGGLIMGLGAAAAIWPAGRPGSAQTGATRERTSRARAARRTLTKAACFACLLVTSAAITSACQFPKGPSVRFALATSLPAREG